MSRVPLQAPGILSDPERRRAAHRPAAHRHRKERVFKVVCNVVAWSSVLLLVGFLFAITGQGVGTLTRHFLTNPPSPDTREAGFFPAMMGSVWLLVLVALIALPLGIATAVYLEEFRPRSRAMRRALDFVQVNITNLAGVPSVVYGVVGLTAFVSMFQLFGHESNPAFESGVKYFDQFYNESDSVLLIAVNGPDAPETAVREGMRAFTPEGAEVEIHVIGDGEDWPVDGALAARTLRAGDLPGRINERTWHYFRIPFGRGVLAGALTLALVILPVMIISGQEALRAVPNSLREAALGLGATRWQLVAHVTLPAAMPGMMTGAILAMSRAIGEAAPLLMIAGIVFISNPPGNIMDDFTAMPLQIYNWAQRPQQDFHQLAASGIIVLLGVLLVFNGVAVMIRQRYSKPLS